MSVIHEIMKRAGAHPGAPRPSLTVRTAEGASPRWMWLMLLLVLGEGALFALERGRRLDAEGKMRQAYLQLNDARGESLERSASAVRASERLQALGAQYDKTQVEILGLQKKNAELTKRMHQTEMEKLRLEQELDALKKEAPPASK